MLALVVTVYGVVSGLAALLQARQLLERRRSCDVSALLFGALLNGTSTRNLDPEVFQPELAGNLTLMIQALVLLFVGADLLILGLYARAKRVGRRRPQAPAAETPT